MHKSKSEQDVRLSKTAAGHPAARLQCFTSIISLTGLDLLA